VKLGRASRLGMGVWVRYLTTGVILAVTRVALFVWLVRRFISHTSTEVDRVVTDWLYPDTFVSIFWNSIVGFSGTKYYLAWGSVITVGSFVMAMPILLVGWLRQRHRIVQITICVLIIPPAVTVLLRVIVLLFGLRD
jgi:hypothetical protein